MLVYLDLNCFNRPFDDQSQLRIAEEIQAIFSILQRIDDGDDDLAWSAALTFENSRHPLEDRRDEIARWKNRATCDVQVTSLVSQRAAELVDAGFHSLDSLHLACAEAAGCGRFLTCDDRLLKKTRRVQLGIEVQNPVEYFEECSDE